MTSNLGSHLIQEYSEQQKNTNEEPKQTKAKAGRDDVIKDKGDSKWNTVKGQVFELLKKSFRPEFLNRIDEVVIFKNLTEFDLAYIVDLQLEGLKKRLAEKDITLVVSDEVKDLLIKEGFDPVYGARPLKRAIQDLLVDELALQIIEGKIKEGQTVSAKREKDTIVFASQGYSIVENPADSVHSEIMLKEYAADVTRSLDPTESGQVIFVTTYRADNREKTKESTRYNSPDDAQKIIGRQRLFSGVSLIVGITSMGLMVPFASSNIQEIVLTTPDISDWVLLGLESHATALAVVTARESLKRFHRTNAALRGIQERFYPSRLVT